MILGYTSGRFTDKEVFLDRLRFFKKIGCNALEIHLKLGDFGIFSCIEEVGQEASDFDYVTIHAPAEPGWLSDSAPAKDTIAQMDKLRQATGAQVMVVHPDVIVEPEILHRLDWPLAIENMDWRKSDGRWVDQLSRWFEIYPEAAMVLDLNHVYTNDRSMQLGRDLWQNFSGRIKHLHLSSFVDKGAIHEPFTKSNCGIILESVPTTKLPEIGRAHV